MVVITAPLTTHSGVRDVYVAEEDRFAVVVTFSGLEFVSLDQGRVVSSGIVLGGFEPLCVAADWTTSSGLLYVGTSGGGVYSTRYHPSRGDGLDFSANLSQLFSTSTTPPISSNVVLDLDVRPGSLFVGTDAGVDYISVHTDRSTRTFSAGAEKVHLTADGEVGYWTTVSSVEVNYDLASTLGGGIIGVDFEYSIISNPALPGPSPKDIAISESSPRTLAFATSSGALVLEEIAFSEATAQTKTLVPSDPAVVSVDFHPDAEFDQGFLSVLSSGRLQVFNLQANSTANIHPQDLRETVTEFSKDQALASGINTIVRTTAVPA